MRRNGMMRKVFLSEGYIVGVRLAGDVRGAGVLRSLMLKGTDVSPYQDRLIDPGFGFGEVLSVRSSVS